jgi:hypothetical protein
MAEKKTRGGPRPGSGRKKMDTGKKQKLTFALSEDVANFLKSHRPASRTLEQAVREYADRMAQALAAAGTSAKKCTQVLKDLSVELDKHKP